MIITLLINEYSFSGVLCYNYALIEGACETLKKLEKLGKQVHLVTNNNTCKIEEFSKLFNFLPVNISAILTIFVNYFRTSEMLYIMRALN